jgi:hypothetical protein
MKYETPCRAIEAARSGDVIEINAEDYYGDVCSWNKDRLTLRGINGRPKIDAAGRNAEGKGTWVIAGKNTTIENIEFTGAKVPNHNGTAIRLEGTNLTVLACYFHDNEEGILTGNDPDSQVVIEYSEFAHNGYGDGYTHNIYVNHVRRFILRFSYSHTAVSGHEVKSRAAENFIAYNRLSDEATGNASYELDLPNGGNAYVVGNVIEKGPFAENPALMSYGTEGWDAHNPGRNLFVVNNTFVSNRVSGATPTTFIQIAPSAPKPALIQNNIFAGAGMITMQIGARLKSNWKGRNPGFVDARHGDYHLTRNSRCVNGGTDPGSGGGLSLLPRFQYVHPACGEDRIAAGALDIGAFEFRGGKPDPDLAKHCTGKVTQ